MLNTTIVKGATMRKRSTKTLVALCVLLVSAPFASAAQEKLTEKALSTRQENIIAISAFTAMGNTDKLKSALGEALNAGLTVNEVEEVIVHVYAYAGFPRSFSAMMTFMSLMDERQAKGIEDEIGKEASPVPAGLDRDAYGAKVRAQLSGQDEVPPPAKWQKFSPVLDKFLKEHLFADLFARDILSFQDRELATIAVLASMTGVDGPLRYHLGAAMNVGLTEAQMKDFISVIESRVGAKEAKNANRVLEGVFKTRAK